MSLHFSALFPTSPDHEDAMWSSSLPAMLVTAWLFAAELTHASLLTPPVLPLIVRNPYLSTWLPNARDVPWERWPMFWTGQDVRELGMELRVLRSVVGVG